MASNMNLGNIPPSRDTIFMRGFSARQHIDDIREFFSHEGGRNTVEFFKEDGNQQLFIALRFDSKDVAKDIIDRFDNTEILGDLIHMQFYKDLRRTRTSDYRGDFRRPMNNNHRSGQDMYHNDDQYDYPRERNDRGGGGYGGRRGSGGMMYSNSMKHSGGGWMGQGGRDHPQQSMGTSRNNRRYTRSSSRSRTPTRSRSSSRSYSRSSSDSKHKKKRSGRKRRSSQSLKRKSNKTVAASSQTPDRTSTQSRGSSVQQSRKNKNKKKRESTQSSDRKQATDATKGKNGESNASDAEMDANTSADVSRLETNEESFKGGAVGQEGAKAARGVRGAAAGDKLKRKSAAGNRARSSGEEEDQQQMSEIGSMDESDSAPAKPVVVTAKVPLKAKKVKEVIPQSTQRQYVEEQVSEEEEEEEEDPSLAKSSTPLVGVAKKGARVGDSKEPIIPMARVMQKPISSNKASNMSEATVTGGAGYNAGAYEEYEPDEGVKRKKKAAPANEDMEEDDELEEEEVEPKRRRTDTSSRDMKSRSHYDDQPRKRPVPNPTGPSANGGRGEPSQGVLSLSQEKVALIKSKKEDIEKAYRQDCETFATVTKMLISKDPDLEERIQQSLRDNLKEIGQRCIQELREFVERVKSEEGIM